MAVKVELSVGNPQQTKLFACKTFFPFDYEFKVEIILFVFLIFKSKYYFIYTFKRFLLLVRRAEKLPVKECGDIFMRFKTKIH